MFRYRCPNAACGRVLQAPPVRAGRPSVCPGCARPLTIPADPKDWLPEAAEPAPAPALTVAAADPASAPDLFPPSEPDLDLFAPVSAEPARAASPTPPPWVPLPEDDEDPIPVWEPSPVETLLPPVDDQAPPAPARADPLPGPDMHTPAPIGLPAVADMARVTLDPPPPGRVIDPAGLAALSARLRPPAPRVRDIGPATAFWVLLTAAGVGLLLLTLFTRTSFAAPVVYLGAAGVEVGYLWVVWRAFRRSPLRGVAAAVPPLTAWYLFRRKYGGFGPLRFVAAGAVLVGLGWAADGIAPNTRAWAGVRDGSPAGAAQPDPAAGTVPARLRELADRRADDRLLALLKELAGSDPVGTDRVAVADEVERLLHHPDPEVRAAAMATDAVWGGPAARERVLAAVRGADRDDRLAALRVLPRWPDDEAARAAAGLLGKPGREGAAARDALAAIGGPAAERAVLPLLAADDQGVRLAVIDLLADEKLGGPASAEALAEVARTTADPGTRLAATAAAERIRGRK